jgi:hypothetical protein
MRDGSQHCAQRNVTARIEISKTIDVKNVETNNKKTLKMRLL